MGESKIDVSLAIPFAILYAIFFCAFGAITGILFKPIGDILLIELVVLIGVATFRSIIAGVVVVLVLIAIVKAIDH